ncbi:D-ornithine 4,5-aminomutase subunit OraE [Paramaledivibacter caminithermalis]|jgi:D-ornithine 4,5-aminomutase subunit beta|uniref:D-ornithine 4,5-aminomutase E subunit n=1 Tax=Paramaledivibacter caminithermalis (strain DSM 15212 / CIP 107654 / DViRD3) TaxID=1121301 RepID=A0A1M6JVS6_PARC5|nr:D-ornithine 4,5-aminomutase subunit OraE [Paramaledivibacter caminithermalis]SHJ50752.1 D-ornithine 4,5-aminomutase E subunit [Paramaledivibacter caminithermalis DSM 15212]
MKKPSINEKMDIRDILSDLENYRPKRRGWTWRKKVDKLKEGPHVYSDCSEPLKNSIGIPAAVRYFDNLDPQPQETITTEIASGRFEDDIRRMRMAAWHGADHIMVIRTAGQSHYDGLIEGSPQGIGGIPVTRKQVRAQRKALDFIEEEVGRPINYHSYVSGVAGPDIAVMFAEEGVNGAHQDPQYNVLYRNINMVRSFVDAAESKKIMAWADMAQIDGAHNANATARDAWKVMPELMVQHGINAIFSYKVGMKKENICLSTVPPSAAPVPCTKYDLPYAVALRDIFDEYKMRAQQNTKYITSSSREATVTHVMNMMISKLTRADIQSTITPDEGRNVPWHMFNIEACDTAKQTLVGLDGLMEMVELKKEGFLPEKVRELKERAVLYLEELLEVGGYFEAVEKGFFVDSGMYPERNGDGIGRKINDGIGVGTVFERDEDYMAPVTAHFGYNNVAQYDENAVDNPSSLIDGCTFEKPEKIVYIDELDENDNVNIRLDESEKYRNSNFIKPEVEWLADGTVQVEIFLPTSKRVAEFAAIEFAKKMNLKDPEVIHVEVMHPAEGTRVQIKGKVEFDLDISTLEIPPEPEIMSDEELWEEIEKKPLKVVAATVGEDEHSVGLREVIDIKHGGIEKWGIEVEYLGTSCPVEKLVDAAIELNADAILASTIISHDDIHYKNMRKLHEYAVEKGIRDKIIIACGGTQVTPEIAVQQGVDAGFGKTSKGVHVATFLVKKRREMENNEN